MSKPKHGDWDLGLYCSSGDFWTTGKGAKRRHQKSYEKRVTEIGLEGTGWVTKESPVTKSRVRTDLGWAPDYSARFSHLWDSWLQTLAGAKPLGRATWEHLWESGGKEGAGQRICLLMTTLVLSLFQSFSKLAKGVCELPLSNLHNTLTLKTENAVSFLYVSHLVDLSTYFHPRIFLPWHSSAK